MADLDSRSKRASSVQLLKAYALDLPLPDGTVDQADRQHSAWDYSGISAQAPAAAVARSWRLERFKGRSYAGV